MSSIGALALAGKTGNAAANDSSADKMVTAAESATTASLFRQNLTDAVRSLGTQTRTGAESSANDVYQRDNSSSSAQSKNAGSTVVRSTQHQSGNQNGVVVRNTESRSGEQSGTDDTSGNQNRSAQNSTMAAQDSNGYGEQTSSTETGGDFSRTAEQPGSGEQVEPNSADDDADAAEADTGDDALAMLAFAQMMNPQQQEALSRIAALTTSGVLDGGVLAQLSDDEVTGLADWALSGAGGLLPEYDGTQATSLAGFGMLEQQDGNLLDELIGTGAADDLSAPDELWPFMQGLDGAEGALADFGLQQAGQAMTRLQNLQQTLSNTGTLGDSLAALSNAEPFSEMSLDRMAQTVSAGLMATAQDAGVDVATTSLPDLLNALPADQVTQLLNNALSEEGATQELPELPEAVVRSLGVQLIGVDSGETAAAAGRNLLDNLDSNPGLRQALLQQMSGEELAQVETPASELAGSAAIAGAESADGGIIIPSESLSANADVQTPVEEEPATSFVATMNAEAGLETTVADEQLAAVAGSAEPLPEEADPESGQTEVLVAEESPVAEAETPAIRVAGKDTGAAEQATSSDADTVEPATASVFAEDLSGNGSQDGQDAGEESLHQEAARLNAGNATEDANQPEGFTIPGTIADRDGIRPASSGLDRSSFGDFGVTAAPDTATPSQSSGAGASSTSTVSYSQMSENINRLQRILQSASSGSDLKNITLQLNPEELGKVTINIELREGAVHATIKTENESARDMLLSGSDQLRRNLESSGVKLDSFDVSVNKEGYDQPDGRNQAGWQAAQEEQQKRFQGQGRTGTGGSADGMSEAAAEEAADTGPGTLPGGALNVVA